MAKLTLIRPNKTINRIADYSIYENGECSVCLENGSKKTINVDPQETSVKAKLHWCGSQTQSFDLAKDDELTLKISVNPLFNRLYIVFALVLVVIGLLNIFLNNSGLVKYGGIGIIVFLLLGILYTITIQKDKWLKVYPLSNQS